MLMQMFDETTATETEWYPDKDPQVVQLEAVLREAQAQAAAAQQSLTDYDALHGGEPVGRGYLRHRQRVLDTRDDADWAEKEAHAALGHAWDAANEKAKELWNARIRQQFRDDIQKIEAFIVTLQEHENTLLAANTAHVRDMLKVPVLFMTAEQVRGRLAYAKGQMGLEQ